MLTRRHIRVKVMQTLYAFKRDEGDSFNDDLKFLNSSIKGMFNLYLLPHLIMTLRVVDCFGCLIIL